jgi:hypothetical protein
LAALWLQSLVVANTRFQTATALVVAALAGAAIWAISPWASGHKEPWDAEGLFYVAALLVGGVISGLFVPRPLWAHYVGSVVGQLGYELLFLQLGALLLLGAVFMLGYSVVFLVGAIGGSHLRLHVRREKSDGEQRD